MDEKSRRLVGDCSRLPYSRGEAERTRNEVVERELRFPFDPAYPETLRLRNLSGRPILTWPPVLPPCDPRGVSSADEFKCWKKPSASTTGIAGSFFSFKAGGRTVCHSFLEQKLLRYFEMCPFVIEIRTQYPAWDREKFLKYCAEGRRMPKNLVMTIDFMLTLRIPGYPFRLYHGVSGKPSALMEEEKVVTRHKKEAENVWQWGTTHEVMTEKTVTNLENLNHRRMFSYMLHTTDIGTHAVAAAELARALRATRARGSLDRVLGMVAKRHGFDSRFGYRLFGIANFLGYLKWDHRFELYHASPLMLDEG